MYETHSTTAQFDRCRSQQNAPSRRSQAACYRWLDARGSHVSGATPRRRSKHAVCCYGGAIYMYGGKFGGISYVDIWRYEIASEIWTKLDTFGEKPPSLQEHTLVAYKHKLFMFGGDFCYGANQETPLWVLCLETLCWSKPVLDSEVVTPTSRRAHTAVVFGAVMNVFGGYVDLRGSSSQLWNFDLDHYQWHLAHSVGPGQRADDGPGPRHSHSAVVHDARMWVYGGMTDLADRSDLWSWNFDQRRWSKVKVRKGAVPDLRGHTACDLGDVMLVFGGTSQGSYQNDLWQFTFESSTWQKVTGKGRPPLARTNHCAVVVTPPPKPAAARGPPSDLPDLIQQPYSGVDRDDDDAAPPVGCFRNRVIPVSVDGRPDVVNNRRPRTAPCGTPVAVETRPRSLSVYPATKQAHIARLQQNDYMQYRDDDDAGVAIMLHEMAPAVRQHGIDNPTFLAEFGTVAARPAAKRIRAVSRDDLIIVDIENRRCDVTDATVTDATVADADVADGRPGLADSRTSLLPRGEVRTETVFVNSGLSVDATSRSDDRPVARVDGPHGDGFTRPAGWDNVLLTDHCGCTRPAGWDNALLTDHCGCTRPAGWNNALLTDHCSVGHFSGQSDSDNDADSAYVDSESASMCHTDGRSQSDLSYRVDASRDSGHFGHAGYRRTNVTLPPTGSDVYRGPYDKDVAGGAPYMLVLGGLVQEAQNMDVKAMRVCRLAFR